MKITQQDLDTIKEVTQNFSKNLMKSQGKDAVARFTKEATKAEIFTIVAAKTKLAMPAFTTKTKLQRELKNCMAALPILKRTFGEKALVDALPAKATNARTIELCNTQGAAGIADLCVKKKNMKP